VVFRLGTGKDGDFIAVNHFTKEGGLFEFDSNDINNATLKLNFLNSCFIFSPH
jgi:hypothetical protein